MPQIDSVFKNIRASLILTNSYVAATLLGGSGGRPNPREYNQMVLDIDFTLGSLTDALIKIEFAPYVAAAAFYQECDEVSSVSAGVDTKSVNTVVHKLTATGKYRLLIPICDEVIKVSVLGEGTVTSSLMAIEAGLLKNYA